MMQCRRRLKLAFLFILGAVVLYACNKVRKTLNHRHVLYLHSKELALSLRHPGSQASNTPLTDIFTSLNLTHIKQLLKPFEQEIETHRQEYLSKSISWTDIKNWQEISGKDEKYFELLKPYPFVKTVLLTAKSSEVAGILPVTEYYNYGSTEKGCDIIRSYKHSSTQSKGEEDVLYNRSCYSDIKRTFVPRPIDRYSLSVGFPYHQDFDPIVLTFVNVFHNALVNNNGEVFSGNLCVVGSRCSPLPILPTKQKDLPYHDEVLAVTQQGQIWYYHATLEDLPRIVPYLSFLHKHQNIKVHISYAGFHVQMLEMLGISEDRLVWGDVRARVVYLPAGTECGRPSVFTTSLLSLVMNHYTASKTGPVPQDTIVLMKRSDPNRQFKTHESILAAIKQVSEEYNLHLKVFNDNPLPSLREAMEMFYRAKVVIGPHGSGFANLAFTRPGTFVIEGLCFVADWYKLCSRSLLCHITSINPLFRNVAAALGLRYYGIAKDDNCFYISPQEVVSPLRLYLQQ